MLKRIQKKWDVSGWRFILILATFAIGGSLTGYIGKKLMPFFGIERTELYLIIYIILVTLLWPLMVLMVSIPFGQFAFFKSYLRKLGSRILRKHTVTSTKKQIRIAIFASGAGSNARKIIEHFNAPPPDASKDSWSHQDVVKGTVSLIVCNKPGAGVLNVAEKYNVPALPINSERFFKGDAYLPELKKAQIDFIVLAGFLWKIPQVLIDAYPRRIINIHPALLPKYGGKGMYGNKVHEAVIKAGEKQSGITIHYVDEQYDNGDVILQEECEVKEHDTAETLAERIHRLEHKYYPKVVEDEIQKQFLKNAGV